MSRVTAWAALRSGSTTPMRHVDRLARARGLDARDTGLARKLVGLVARRQGTLRAVTQHFIDRKAKPDLTAHLHLGLAQVLFLDRIPPHAAVNETLGAVRETLGASKVPKVNAILRNTLRALQEGTSGDPRQDLIERPLHFDRPVFRDPETNYLLWAEDALSMPAQIGKRWVKRYGRERFEELALQAIGEPPLVLRVLRGEVETAMAELAEAQVEVTRVGESRSLSMPSAATETVLGLSGFSEGRWIVQGAWASSAADAVRAQPGERVLDLCAAPGGKSAVLAETGASVLALDVSPWRLAKLTGNIARLGLDIPAVASDGTSALASDTSFDAVLIDAPCSNTGVLSARPEARWRFGPKTLSELVDLQSRLLRDAIQRVRPGGRLLWSTCSLEPEENERLVDTLLKEWPNLRRGEERSRLPGEEQGSDGGSIVEILTAS